MLDSKKAKAQLRLDIIKAFGADFDLEIRDSLFFVSENINAIVYPVGHHIAIRNLFVRDELRRNDIMFIYNDPDVIKMTSMNVNRENSLLLVCEKKSDMACISIYHLSKLNFNSVTIFKPKRKVCSTQYSEFLYASFSWDGNYIASIGVIYNLHTGQTTLQGVVWDVQIFQPFKEDNYKQRCYFDLPNTVNKITLENKMLCTSGNGHLNFWHIYENTVKPLTDVRNLNVKNNNFLDHDWIKSKTPTIVVITDKNDIYILEGMNSEEKNKKKKDKNEEDNEEEFTVRVDRFLIKQHIRNCFKDYYINANVVRALTKGIIVGSNQGDLLFVEKVNQTEFMYKPVISHSREKSAKVVGIACNPNEEYLAVAYNTNELCSLKLTNIFDNLKMNIIPKEDSVCDGFHKGPITTMDVALQRPIIVTCSQFDKTIRVWNYLTGHCEYCKIILTQKEENEKELDILSISIHPNGYYLAVSDKEMIRFFHLCYKELRFYNNDIVSNEPSKNNCHLLKFSNGGHLLGAVSGKTLFIIRSYSRETVREFKTPHVNQIKQIVFDDLDHYVYTIGNDGIIVEYNLFSFQMYIPHFIFRDEISGGAGKYINYSGGVVCSYDDKTSIVACGHQSTNKFIISEFFRHDNSKLDDNINQVDERVSSITQVKSKKYDINSLATGGDDGYVSLFQYPYNETKNPWDSIKAHRSNVNAVVFCRDTNLLFTTGDDGNLFIYCIYELPDGENIAFDENKITNINQLVSILDEGLGDNVLYPLDDIFKNQEKLTQKELQISEYGKQEAKSQKEFDNKLRERENELTRQKEKELRMLNENLKEMKIANEATIEHFEDKNKKLVQDHNKIIIEKDTHYNEKLDQNSYLIHDLSSQLAKETKEHQLELQKKDEDFIKKMAELENIMKKKFQEYTEINETLKQELEKRQKDEEEKFNHLDKEHEQEIGYKQEKYELQITELINKIHEYAKKLDDNIAEIKKKDDIIQEKENTKKALNEKIVELTGNLNTARKNLEDKDKEFSNLKERLNENEKTFQVEKKISGFASKLKNELYRKNNEISGKCNKQQADINELKINSQNTEKELEESLRLLENYEKESKKQKALINELQKKIELERQLDNKKTTYIDTLLQKIYKTFELGDKHKIINEMGKIYNEYITNDVKKQIASNQINPNIRDELGKQIDYLQKTYRTISDAKIKKEAIQKSEINRRTYQNSELIEMLNKLKEGKTELENELKKQMSEKAALKKKLSNYIRQEEEMKKIQSKKSNRDRESRDHSLEHSQEISEKDQENLPGLKNKENSSTSELYIANMESKQKKPVKGKLFKSNVLSQMHKQSEDSYKLSEILKVIEEKNSIIVKQKMEIQRLRNIELQVFEMNKRNNYNNEIRQNDIDEDDDI